MDQSAVIALLSDPASYSHRPQRVERVETHGAIVFLAGDDVLKIKRAVRYPYMDFSTPELRRRVCEREIELNRRFAPEIYQDVLAITREEDGRLQIDGNGAPVEWAVHMRRFPEDAVLARLAERGAITPTIIENLAETVVAMHRTAPVDSRKAHSLAATADKLLHGLAAGGLPFDWRQIGQLASALRHEIHRTRVLLRLRQKCGFVRRCHGDLHLGNIVLLDGRPVPFDALEFDEALATTDTLYDLAFLLMDLEHRRLRREANHLLNRYLQLTGDPCDLHGLRALPLFLSLRAAIRALVSAQRSTHVAPTDKARGASQSGGFLELALAILSQSPPRLIAIGGLSGTGKSTLAKHLAPMLGRAPGAVHLRSDIERKRLAGVADAERLPVSHYSATESGRVYAQLQRKARLALRAGQSVVVDGVFAQPFERADIEALARRLAVPFSGLWLSADPAILQERVRTRSGDASDATPAIVQLQVMRGTGVMTWHIVDASGPVEATMQSARQILTL